MSHKKVKRDKVAFASGNSLETQIQKMRSLFPDVFVEGGKDDAIAQSHGPRAVHQLELGAARAAHHRP